MFDELVKFFVVLLVVVEPLSLKAVGISAMVCSLARPSGRGWPQAG